MVHLSKKTWWKEKGNLCRLVGFWGVATRFRLQRWCVKLLVINLDIYRHNNLKSLIVKFQQMSDG